MKAPAEAVLAALILAGCIPHAAHACNPAAAPPVPLIKGVDYDQARTALLAAGWVPGHGSTYSQILGNELAFHERGYTELRSCTMDRDATCHFIFQSPSRVTLLVTTAGAENALLDSKAIVSGAELGCLE